VFLSLGKYGRVVRETDNNIHEEPVAFIFKVEDTVQENVRYYSPNDVWFDGCDEVKYHALCTEVYLQFQSL